MDKVIGKASKVMKSYIYITMLVITNKKMLTDNAMYFFRKVTRSGGIV